MMTVFEMVKYHSKRYPDDIPLRIEEKTAHFDTTSLSGDLMWSIHTDLSHERRAFDNEVILNFPELRAAQRNMVPQLWKNEEWAKEFAEFIIRLVDNQQIPAVIEIHPPYDDYADLNSFVQIYSVFENIIKERFPTTKILIENRFSGSRSHQFIFSTIEQLESLAAEIKKRNLSLRLAFDVMAIYTAYDVKAEAEEEYISLLEQAKSFRDMIGGVHLWGKRLFGNSKIAHKGDLNSYFNNANIKAHFLQAFKDTFDDGVARNLVLEVNDKQNYLQSIIDDLKSAGIQFV